MSNATVPTTAITEQKDNALSSRPIHPLPRRPHENRQPTAMGVSQASAAGPSTPRPKAIAASRGLKRRISEVRPSDDTPLRVTPKRKRRRLDPGLALRAPVPTSPIQGPDDSRPGAIIILRRLWGEEDEPLTKLDIIQAVASTFHEPPYTQPGEPLMNFHISMQWDWPPRAFVTLPDQWVAELFKKRRDRIWHPYEADFYLSVEVATRQRPDPWLVYHLQNKPFEPLDKAVARERLSAELAQRVPLENLTFGIWTNDEVFSAEYTIKSSRTIHDDPLQVGALMMWYDLDEERLVLQCSRAPRPALQNHREMVEPRSIASISVRDIAYVWAHASTNSVLFHMYSPPFFDNNHPEYLHYGKFGEMPFERIRTRYFDEGHAASAGFSSSTLLIQFDYPQRFKEFMGKATQIDKFPTPINRRFSVDDSLKLSSEDYMSKLQGWYKQITLNVALACEQVVHNALLTPLELLGLRKVIEDSIRGGGPDIAATAIGHLADTLRSRDRLRLGRSSTSLSDEFKEACVRAVLEKRSSRSVPVIEDMASCHQVYITPTGLLLEGPFVDRSNRVLRLYPEHHHHFLRVAFTDEGGHGRRLRKPRKLVDWDMFLEIHVGKTLRHGFELAGRTWKWLGYSQSALKDHSVLFMSPFVDNNGVKVDAESIRNGIGNFSKVIHQPAKYGARIAQAFTATSATIVIPAESIHTINDIEHDGHVFTDGAGDMSFELAQDIWQAMSKQKNRRPASGSIPPSAFQARFGGSKGVWMINPTLKGRVIRCRPSQIKFESDSRAFDVCVTSQRPTVTYLNRPLVNLLEDLGVPAKNLLAVQQRAVSKIEQAQISFVHAARLIRLNGLGGTFRMSTLLTHLSDMLGIDFDISPRNHIDFFRSITMLSITHCLRMIKYKARIPVEGPTLIGVCDTYGILREGQAYIKVKGKNGLQPALKGRVVVTRSPVIHPGDIQFVEAIGEVSDASPLKALTNVVVFSSLGKRPLASMLGGGDLDGDLFNILTDGDLYPEDTFPAGQYTAVTPRILDRPSTMSDISQFVVDYMIGDLVSFISNKHLIIADQSPQGSYDSRCLKLAELASHAVDFPKSGVAVNIKDCPRPTSKVKPDFMASPYDDADEDCYPSKKALGQMFRAVPIQKYVRPSETERDGVDASVLFKILEAIQDRFPEHRLEPPKAASSAYEWKDVLEAFSVQAQKIAFRNAVSRDTELLEEELVLGASSAPGKLSASDMELIHRAKVQITETVIKLRRTIIDKRKEDEDDDDDDDEEWDAFELEKKVQEMEDESNTVEDEEGDGDVDGPMKEEEEDLFIKREENDSSLARTSAAHPPARHRRSSPTLNSRSNPIIILDSDDEGPSARATDHNDDDIEEVARPHWRQTAIRRAYKAAYYSFDRLSKPSAQAPFGTRLFSLVALEVLMALLNASRKASRPNPNQG